MNESAIVARNISKRYELGTINRKTLAAEVEYLWHKLRGRDPRVYMDRITHSSSATEQRRIIAGQEGNNEFWALKDVSFCVQPGEVVGIIGRNGAGKSTLLKILSRITDPTEGDVVLNGRLGSLLEVGTGFHPELTGRENVYMNGAILGMKTWEIDARFDEIVAFAEIDKFIDTPVKRYSSGMYVRLAFAVAANLSSEILIVDEVLAVGDIAFQRKCLGYMSSVANAGRTVLFVSHNMGAVRNLCTRAIWLHDGCVCRDGLVDDVVNDYQSEDKGITASSDGFFHRPPEDVLLGKLTWVRALRIAHPNGQPSQHFNYGDDVRIDYYLDGQPAREGCALLWVIQDSWGANIAWSDSARLCGYRLKNGQMNGTCIIHNLPLSSGRYYLTVTCGIAGACEAKDLWRQALYFDVVECDPFETRNDVSSSSLGSVILEQSWQDITLA